MASSIFIGYFGGATIKFDGTSITFTNPILEVDGTASAPSYSFASRPTSGMYSIDATTPVAISIAGTVKYGFRGSGNGLFLATDIPISWNDDTQLSRGAANRLDLATGDSLKLVSGVVTGGGLLSPLITVTTLSTAGVEAYTAAQVAGGLILRDCNGAGRADTAPTAAALKAVIPGAQVGQGVRFTVRNTSSGATSITMTVPDASVTISGTATVAQNNSKDFLAVFTNVTAASEAYTLYSLGTTVF